jgi:histidine triad (HIT) family protein
MDSLFNLDQACTFCQIAANEAEASVVYQDDLVTAFMDLFPVTPGHTLVIPNQHATMITEIDPNTVGHMFEIGVRIDQALRDSDLRCEAVSLYLADGAAAGQAVLHSHLHVVPRFQADSCGLHLHAGPAERANRKMLEEHAEAIRRSLESEI